MISVKQNEIWFDVLMKVAISEVLGKLPSKEELNEKYVPFMKLDFPIELIEDVLLKKMNFMILL